MHTQIRSFFFHLILTSFLLAPSLIQAQTSTSPPVQCKFLSVDKNAEVLLYEVKINSDKTLRQADLEMKRFDAAGKLLGESKFAWQNNLKGTLQPIEKSKTYPAKWLPYEDGTVKGECSVIMVHFTDNSKWSAK